VAVEPAEVRRRAGIIFQNPSLDLNLTAEENVRFHAVLYGLYPFRPAFSLMPKSYRSQVQELAQVLGIAGDLFKPLRTFSGGMRRKLEILRSLIHHPTVLFLDEPTSGLDPLSRRDLWEYLRQMRLEEGTTVFLTTHYLEEAEGADAVTIINKGRIVASGTPDDVKASLVDEYLEVDADDRRVSAGWRGWAWGGPPYHVRSPRTSLRLRAPHRDTRQGAHAPSLEDAYSGSWGGRVMPPRRPSPPSPATS
jgi:ABC-2 type transport system ATP-binding protein